MFLGFIEILCIGKVLEKQDKFVVLSYKSRIMSNQAEKIQVIFNQGKIDDIQIHDILMVKGEILAGEFQAESYQIISQNQQDYQNHKNNQDILNIDPLPETDLKIQENPILKVPAGLTIPKPVSTRPFNPFGLQPKKKPPTSVVPENTTPVRPAPQPPKPSSSIASIPEEDIPW